MIISRLCAPYHLNHSLYRSPACKISICCLNVFKRVFYETPTYYSKEFTYYQKFGICKVLLTFYSMQTQINDRRPNMPLEQTPGLQGSDAEKYQQSLMELIQSIKGWEKLNEIEQEVQVFNFMDTLGHLFLDYFQFHLDESNACAVQYQSLLNYSVDPITSYIINLWGRLEGAGEYEDPWDEACWGRTNIEAFNTMFKQVLDPPLNPQCIDRYMNDRKGTAFLPWRDIPKNAPVSHWWWFEKFGTSWLEED